MLKDRNIQTTIITCQCIHRKEQSREAQGYGMLANFISLKSLKEVFKVFNRSFMAKTYKNL